MILTVDRTIYSDACISKTIYSLSDKFSFVRNLKDKIETIEMRCKDEECEDIDEIFYERLNDYKLRQIIAEETKDIRTLIYAKAFMNDDKEGE